MDKNNPQHSRSIRNRGFTLIEMMVTVAILAILIAAVTPSFRGILRDNQAATQASAVVTSLMLARSEAIKRNAPVAMCRSNTGTSCAGSDWADGWILWTDIDGDAAVDSVEIVQVREALAGNFALTATGSSFTYRPDGSVTGAADSFELLPSDGDTDYGRCVAVDVTGRPSVTKGACP
ncbi:MAG: GspH/FimT family pseudopilin [Gammaproteobacteria bacterium]